jgi:ABC-type transport system substrate-binding protein
MHAASMLARFMLRVTERRRFRMLSRRAALLSTAALPFVASAQAQPQQTLRIAMTVADIPATDGAPDQGTEGIRFMGYTLYDPLIMWDLSSATAAARLVPGLATKWYQDPADPTKWIFELRQGVTFHDGSTFNADAVIFTLDRALDEKSPSFDRVGRNTMIASLWPIAAYRKIDAYKVEMQTKGVDTLMPSLLNRIMIASPPTSTRSAGTGKPIASRPRAPGRGR